MPELFYFVHLFIWDLCKNVMLEDKNVQNNILIQFITRCLKVTYCTKHLAKIIMHFDQCPLELWLSQGSQQRVMWRLVLVGHQCSLAKAQAAFPHAQHSYRSDYYLHCFSALIRIPICCLSSPHNTSSTHSQYCPVMLYFYMLTSDIASPFHMKTGWRSCKHLNSDY